MWPATSGLARSTRKQGVEDLWQLLTTAETVEQDYWQHWSLMLGCCKTTNGSWNKTIKELRSSSKTVASSTSAQCG